jgi:quercetin dioxygenase-like cupin family protein
MKQSGISEMNKIGYSSLFPIVLCPVSYRPPLLRTGIMLIRNVIATATLTLAIGLQQTFAAQSGFTATPILTESKTITGQALRYSKTKSPEVTSVLVKIAPGGESGRHKHPVAPQIYVIEGEVTIEFDDGKQKKFPAGKAFIEAVHTWHNAKNLGDKPVKMLVVFFGDKGKKNMIRP